MNQRAATAGIVFAMMVSVLAAAAFALVLVRAGSAPASSQRVIVDVSSAAVPR
jgi:hypothetical protein